MSVEENIEARHQALMSLVACGLYLRDRDNLIRRAAALGIAKGEIARLLGLSDKQVYRIAARKEPGAPQATSPVGDAPAQPKDDTP